MISRDPAPWRWCEGRLICQLLQDFPHGFGTSATYPAFPSQLARAWWQGEKAVWAEQIHGDHLAAAEVPKPQADALYTQRANTSVWVSTADCVPVVIAGPGVVAAVHAGWRGTAAQILPKVITQLVHQAGIAPEALILAIGPCISGAVYQVSQAVAAQVSQTLPSPYASQVVFGDPEPEKARVDLALVNAYQAQILGVGAIAISPYCTYAHPDRFFSYRRLGTLKNGDHPSRVQWSGISLPGLPTR